MLGNKRQLVNALPQESFWEINDQLLVYLIIFFYV